MAKLYLIRHGEPASTWGSHPDPGLSTLGHTQADNVARLLSNVGSVHLVTSPLARCRQTAAPTCTLRGQEAEIVSAVGEIGVPAHISDHRAWLSALMQGTWGDEAIDPQIRLWRDQVGDTLIGFRQDTIIFTHFVAINAAVGIATGQDQVMACQPAHTSVTILENIGSGLKLLKLGHESTIQLA